MPAGVTPNGGPLDAAMWRAHACVVAVPLVGWCCSGLAWRCLMPRTVWSGAISFGLVTVPINVQSATEDHSVHFHQYHLEDMGRVRVRKFCETRGPRSPQ
ncbi:hypothetical protein GCM10027074_75210 [Streptomyces deserti]